jgi:tRNA A37 threonylcarbamoyladenosine biosynthesis protein TsaE
MSNRSCEFELTDETGTAALGRALAAALPSRAVVGLIGPLGAGKTRLV